MATRKTTSLPHTVLPIAHEYQTVTNQGNWDRQRDPIKQIVMHTIVGTIQGATAKFSNPDKRSSAHYGIGLDGQIYQWVGEDCTAYHATKLAVNRYTIGIEHEDKGNYNGPRTDALYRTSAKLVHDICTFYNLPIDSSTIIRHKDVAATACPDALDVERVIREANALVVEKVEAVTSTPSTPVAAMPPQGSTQITLEEFRAIQFLREKLQELKVDGKPFGNSEGMLRSLVDTYKTYTDLVKPTQDGKPSVVLPGGLFADLSIKAKHLDTVADLLGYPAETRVTANFGAVLAKMYQDALVKSESKVEAISGFPENEPRETVNGTNSSFYPDGTPVVGLPQTGTPLFTTPISVNSKGSGTPKNAIGKLIQFFLKEI